MEEIRGYLDVVGRRWIVILACTVIVTCLAIAYTFAAGSTYVAKSSLLLMPTGPAAVLQANNADSGAAAAVNIAGAVELLKSPELQDRVQSVVPGAPVARLSNVTSTNLVQISVSDSNAGRATAAAAAYAHQYVKLQRMITARVVASARGLKELRIKRLENQIDQFRPEARNSIGQRRQRLESVLVSARRSLSTLRTQLKGLQTTGLMQNVGGKVLSVSPAVKTRSVSSAKYGVLGLVAGVLLGLAIALALELTSGAQLPGARPRAQHDS
jgi:hypothetical protein